MYLYLIERTDTVGYDEFDSAVVSAKDEQDARIIHPSFFVTHTKDGKWMGTYTNPGEKTEYETGDETWLPYSQVNELKVTLLGTANDDFRGVILSSFNAG